MASQGTHLAVKGDNVIRLLWIKEAAGVRAMYYKPREDTVLLELQASSEEFIQQMIMFHTGGGVDVCPMSAADFGTAVGSACLCLASAAGN